MAELDTTTSTSAFQPQKLVETLKTFKDERSRNIRFVSTILTVGFGWYLWNRFVVDLGSNFSIHRSFKSQTVSLLELAILVFFFTKIKYPCRSSGIKGVPARMLANLQYYLSNYIVVFLILCIWTVLSNPFFLLIIVGLAVLWLYSSLYMLDFKLGIVNVGLRERSIILTILTGTFAN